MIITEIVAYDAIGHSGRELENPSCCSIQLGLDLSAGSSALARKHSRRIPLERLPSTGVVPSRLELTGSCARKCPEHFDDALSLAEFHASLEGAAGRFVHGLVKTVLGQYSRPVSIAARSLLQNSSSCFWRRAIASRLPSSMVRFRFDMMPPPAIRVGDAVTRSFVSSTRGRERS